MTRAAHAAPPSGAPAAPAPRAEAVVAPYGGPEPDDALPDLLTAASAAGLDVVLLAADGDAVRVLPPATAGSGLVTVAVDGTERRRAGTGPTATAVAPPPFPATPRGGEDLVARLGAAGLADEEARALAAALWARGIAPAVTRVATAGTLRDVLAEEIARRRGGALPAVAEDPAWTLTIDGSPLLERVRESLFTLADGQLGSRGSLVVEAPGATPAVVHAGVYAGTGAESRLLHAPRWNVVTVADAGPRESVRSLDLRTGTARQTIAGADGPIEALLFSSLAAPGTTVLRARGSGVRPGRPLRAPAEVITEEVGSAGGRRWMRVVEAPASVVAAAAETVAEGDPPRLDRIAAYVADAGGIADEHAALDRLGHAEAAGADGLLAAHRRAWAARWESADVEVEGDPELGVAVRLALFHLMACANDEREAAVGARNLSGEAYNGHVFWDSDVFVLPFLAATHPPAARAMLEYRVRRVPRAMEAARALGGAGARFPWESAATGEEVAPADIRAPDGTILPVRTGALEEHIVADVAWAAVHYAEWTGDRAFAAGPGLALLLLAARWWASRIELDADSRAHIRRVMGPDEYHGPVDDNAYTNVMARWTLRRAAAAGVRGGIEARERRRWTALADGLVDGLDPVTGVYEQFAGFADLEPLRIADVAPRRPVAADLLLGPERVAAAQVVKQADVLMLHYLVPEETAAGSLAANLDHYEPRTSHGSTLSPGVHATLLARARRAEEALALLRLTARIDLDDIGQMTAGGVHLAAMGSVWRTLAHGFCGLQPAGDALAVDPVPVPGLEALAVRVRFRDTRVRVRVTPEAVELTAERPTPVVLAGHGRVEAGPRGLRLPLADPERTA